MFKGIIYSAEINHIFCIDITIIAHKHKSKDNLPRLKNLSLVNNISSFDYVNFLRSFLTICLDKKIIKIKQG